MKVAHVHRIRGIGGSERHLLALLPALAERGIEPVLIGLDDPDWSATDFYGALRVPSIRIRAAHDYTLDMSAANVVLEGSRRMSKNQQLAVAIAPLDPPTRWRSRLPRLRRQQDREVSR